MLLTVSPSGASPSYIAAAAGPKVVLINCSTGERVDLESPLDSAVCALQLSPSGFGGTDGAAYLAASTTNKNLVVWECATGKRKGTRHLTKRVSSLSFLLYKGSVEGAAAVPPMIIATDKLGDVHAYPVPDIAAGKRLMFGHTATIVTCSDVSPDTSMMATGDRDEKVRLTFLPYGHEVHGFCLGHTKAVTQVNFVPGSSGLVVSGSADGTLRVWDAATCKSLHEATLPMRSASAAAAAASGGGGAGGGAGAGTAGDDAGDGSDDTAFVNSLAMSPTVEGLMVASTEGSSTVRVYQVQRAALSTVATVEADAAVTSLRFQADGTLIVGQATCQAVAYKPVQKAGAVTGLEAVACSWLASLSKPFTKADVDAAATLRKASHNAFFQHQVPAKRSKSSKDATPTAAAASGDSAKAAKA